MKTIYYLLTYSLFINHIHSQKIYKGTVFSNGMPVEYAILHVKNKTSLYADEKGMFTINTDTANDTLIIEAVGYLSKEVLLINQPENFTVELEPNTQLLNEVVIAINGNEKSKWRKINKKTKKYVSTHQGLAEGYKITSTYKIEKETKFNGIRLFIMPNPLNNDFNKKVRPIMIINSENLENNIFLNKIIPISNNSDRFTKLDIEFKNTIQLLPNETLTIGLELIPENLSKPNKNNVVAILSTKYLLKESKTVLNNFSLNKQNFVTYEKLDEDLYFELKVVK